MPAVCVLLQGGKTIKGITAASGVTAIETNNNGTVQIVGSNEAAINAAKEMITLLLDQLPPGVCMGQRLGSALFWRWMRCCCG